MGLLLTREFLRLVNGEEEGRRRDPGVGRVADDARVEAQAAAVLQGRQERRLCFGVRGSGFEDWGLRRDAGSPRGTERAKRGALVKSFTHTIPVTISNHSRATCPISSGNPGDNIPEVFSFDRGRHRGGKRKGGQEFQDPNFSRGGN